MIRSGMACFLIFGGIFYNHPMSTPILATKLYIPPPRPNAVLRPRLIEQLNEGLGQNQGFENLGFSRKLTLISAPAGFGKTTLVSSWVDNLQVEATNQEKIVNPKSKIQNRIAWLSLDEGDNDPARFLTYLVAALQASGPPIGTGALALLQSPQPPPIESLLTPLLNEIAALPDNLILVLDDYHLIEAQPIDAALAFLIEHLPPQMHLVVTTREDPHLPLARYRVRGQMTELRAIDLRFTAVEAATFLNQVMGSSLSPQETAWLETRTEGWIAGLQLAALSMQGRDDISGFIKAFAGDNRYIVDYLVEEVLQRQPEHVRIFLLQTSILERLNGRLCDAVCFAETADTGQKEVNEMLETLERDNLFVIPLDDKRHWFRYHHLFADVLQARLMKEQPKQVPTLHQRASRWYEQNDLPVDAIRHALVGKDYERAAGLIELTSPAMRSRYQDATLLGWVKALPDELLQTRPVLSVEYAWALLSFGELERGEAHLRDTERWLATISDDHKCSDGSATQMVVVDDAAFRLLPATIAAAYAFHAGAIGDAPRTVTYAKRALELLPEDDHFQRAIPAALLGLAYWASGDLEAASRALTHGMTSLQKDGKILLALSGTPILANIKVAQGRLLEAIRTYEQSFQLVAAQDETIFPGVAGLYVGLAELHCERGNLTDAAQHLQKSEALGEQAVIPGDESRLYAAMARIKATLGDIEEALELLNEAERLYKRDPLPDIRPITALKARIWLRQGQLTDALAWAREQGLSVNDALSYLREFEYITLARILIDQYRRDRIKHSILEAMDLLTRLLQAADGGGRMGSVIELLVLLALAHEAQGNIPGALAPLERALTLAEPEGYIRVLSMKGCQWRTCCPKQGSKG